MFCIKSDYDDDDDEITVCVGKQERKFRVSIKRLQAVLPDTKLEDYASYCIPDMERENYDSYRLPEMDERTFELFEHWLRNKTLDELDTDNEDVAKHEMLEYLELYFEATKWGIQDLENLIMDRFRERYKCEDGYFPCFLIKKIYDNTEEGAPLRRYIVDSFLFKSAEWESDNLAEAFNRHFEKGNRGFLLDCYRAALKLAKGKVHDADCHERSPGCDYHKHSDGKECGVEQARKRRKIG